MFVHGYDHGNTFLQKLFVTLFKSFTICRIFHGPRSPSLPLFCVFIHLYSWIKFRELNPITSSLTNLNVNLTKAYQSTEMLILNLQYGTNLTCMYPTIYDGYYLLSDITLFVQTNRYFITAKSIGGRHITSTPKWWRVSGLSDGQLYKQGTWFLLSR